jgi:hypothetical protein
MLTNVAVLFRLVHFHANFVCISHFFRAYCLSHPAYLRDLIILIIFANMHVTCRIILDLIILILATINVVRVLLLWDFMFWRNWLYMLQFSGMWRRALMNILPPFCFAGLTLRPSGWRNTKHLETYKHDVIYQKIVFFSIIKMHQRNLAILKFV